jgi:hypothetical protein
MRYLRRGGALFLLIAFAASATFFPEAVYAGWMAPKTWICVF